MSKQNKTTYVCQSCGYQTPKWMGRCPDCSRWNSMVEEKMECTGKATRSSPTSKPESISGISIDHGMKLNTNLSEFDRTLGGGVVPGSLILIGGDPGIGKSTLILQVLEGLAERDCRAFYISGEESPQQIKLRAERLSVHSGNLFVIAGTCIENLFEELKLLKPDIVAVDSVQTMYTDSMTSTPGSVGQVREVASQLMAFAKQNGVPVFIVGHVTKEGAIAGPKVLEHMVDTVLYFEGDRGHDFRILRSVKNRYGPTNEIGVFEMKDTGLAEVENPSHIFLQERLQDAPGSLVIPCLEGTRPVLVEIQALVGPSPLSMPRRTALGAEHNRISLLVAVLGKKMGMELGDQDIFVNVAGGLKVEEPAADVGIISAMMSSFLNRPVDKELVVFGEVGLAGEIRGVSQPGLRIREAEKLGFTRCLLPKNNLKGADSSANMELTGVASIQDLYEHLFKTLP